MNEPDYGTSVPEGIKDALVTNASVDWCSSPTSVMHGTYSRSLLIEDLTTAADGTPIPQKLVEPRRRRPTQPRNAKCACGSGKKYKHCHGGINLR